MERRQKKKLIGSIIILILISTLIYVVFNVLSSKITNFEECVFAGNPVMESYPRQCIDSATENKFIEEILDYWRLDEITLMQHETEEYFGCFGCSISEGSPALCVDPTSEMKPVEETQERYCNENFKVMEKTVSIKCFPEQRNVNVCIEIYQPVCATVNIQCVTTPCEPIRKTYSNSCKACSNSLVSDYINGEC
jgi:hypothetical protein